MTKETGIQTIMQILGKLIENITNFFINISQGYIALITVFFIASLISLILYFMEDIIKWIHSMRY